MYLSNELSNNKMFLAENNIQIPRYDREKLIKMTNKNPTWVHLGAGNIFRAFLAPILDDLIEEGHITGVIVAEGYDYEIIDYLKRFDSLTLSVTFNNTHSFDQKIVSSISELLKMDTENKDFERLKEIFSKASLQIVSLTITEKGYSLKNTHGQYLPDVIEDIRKGPAQPKSYIGRLTTLLYERFTNGSTPLALVSLDNMSHNGDKLKDSILTLANKWYEKKLVSLDFIKYLDNSNKISFPLTMIDKITPRPDLEVAKTLTKTGFTDIKPIVTKKGTYIAPYVNSEKTQYLVIEDSFPNGRPLLEKKGVIFTNKETVNLVETMKVTTCLNPLHTALAIFGSLFNYQTIYEAVQDELLLKLIKRLGYKEGLPVVENPVIISPEKFLEKVIDIRFANEYIPDTPQRIATDTSQKLSVRFGETLKAYKMNNMSTETLIAIPLVFAGWLRYLMGLDDNGDKLVISSDPMLEDLIPLFSKYDLGDKPVPPEELKGLLENKNVFGVDLFEYGLADKVMKYFNEMRSSNLAIRRTLSSYL